MALPALRQPTDERRFQIDQLKQQIKQCTSVSNEARVLVTDFLIAAGIFSLEEIDEKTKVWFSQYLFQKKVRNKAKINSYLCALAKCRKEYQRWQFRDLLEEAAGCCSVSNPVKNKALDYLMEQGIHKLQEIDYDLRKKYEQFLQNSIAKGHVPEYVKGLDKLKRLAIKNEGMRMRMPKPHSHLVGKYYLPYFPVYEVAERFKDTHDENTMVWDFNLEAPEHLKKQVYQVLIYALTTIKDTKDLKTRYLRSLKLLYQYCIEESIEDLEYMEKKKIDGFRQFVERQVGRVGTVMQIVDNARKILFKKNGEPDWKTDVWYLEQMNIKRYRTCPSNPVVRISFLGVTNPENRKMLKEYMKYEIGTTDRALSSINQEHHNIVKFLQFIGDASAVHITTDEAEGYFKSMDGKVLKEATYNQRITAVLHFYRYLKSKRYISKIPLHPEYLYKKEIPVHHDRAVDDEIVDRILDNLIYFPPEIRLIFLCLFSCGVRISEACALRGDAFEQHNGNATMKVYQNKMRTEKMIYIPDTFYDCMTKYIRENEIGPDEYIFKNRKGGAYNAGAFGKKMKRYLLKCGISEEEYKFRSHDYRHKVATRLYQDGASIQAIRDYLGHESTNMTRQYIDHMPDVVAKKSAEYFENKEKLLKQNKEGNNNEE